jgi:cytochrome c oxidase subunit 2
LGVAVLAQAAQDGERLANQRGCLACHSTDGSGRTGPTWQGLAGSQVRLSDGSMVTADDT